MVSSKKSDRDDGGGTPGVVTRSQSRQQHMPANEAGTPSPPPVAVGGDPPVPAEAGTTDPWTMALLHVFGVLARLLPISHCCFWKRSAMFPSIWLWQLDTIRTFNVALIEVTHCQNIFVFFILRQLSRALFPLPPPSHRLHLSPTTLPSLNVWPLLRMPWFAPRGSDR